MPSPFPGMNPYIEHERVWHDFHERFMPFTAEAIGAQTGPQYIVRIDEHVYIRELRGTRRLTGRADLAVARTSDGAGALTGAVVQDAPARVRLPQVDVERESFVEIRDLDWQLVTVIELLSPANKRSGRDRQQYLTKRAELLASDVHLVEIDLLRGGRRLPMQDLPECAYCVLVSRAESRPAAGLWPLGLRDALPRIPIPLRSPEADVELDLQRAVHHTYDAAQYERYIYAHSPQPPLSPADAEWARERISG